MSTTNLTARPALSFSTETEIYFTADGQVIVADLPLELADLMLMLGEVQPCEILNAATSPAVETQGHE